MAKYLKGVPSWYKGNRENLYYQDDLEDDDLIEHEQMRDFIKRAKTGEFLADNVAKRNNKSFLAEKTNNSPDFSNSPEGFDYGKHLIDKYGGKVVNERALEDSFRAANNGADLIKNKLNRDLRSIPIKEQSRNINLPSQPIIPERKAFNPATNEGYRNEGLEEYKETMKRERNLSAPFLNGLYENVLDPLVYAANAPFRTKLGNNILLNAGETFAGKGSMMNPDGSPMEKKDAGLVGNFIADTVGLTTGMAYNPAGGIGGGGSLLNLTDNLGLAARDKLLQKLPQTDKALLKTKPEKILELGKRLVPSMARGAVDNAVGDMALSQLNGDSLEDTLKQGAYSALGGAALFGTGKLASEINNKAKRAALKRLYPRMFDDLPIEERKLLNEPLDENNVDYGANAAEYKRIEMREAANSFEANREALNPQGIKPLPPNPRVDMALNRSLELPSNPNPIYAGGYKEAERPLVRIKRNRRIEEVQPEPITVENNVEKQFTEEIPRYTVKRTPIEAAPKASILEPPPIVSEAAKMPVIETPKVVEAPKVETERQKKNREAKEERHNIGSNHLQRIIDNFNKEVDTAESYSKNNNNIGIRHRRELESYVPRLEKFLDYNISSNQRENIENNLSRLKSIFEKDPKSLDEHEESYYSPPIDYTKDDDSLTEYFELNNKKAAAAAPKEVPKEKVNADPIAIRETTNNIRRLKEESLKILDKKDKATDLRQKEILNNEYQQLWEKAKEHEEILVNQVVEIINNKGEIPPEVNQRYRDKANKIILNNALVKKGLKKPEAPKAEEKPSILEAPPIKPEKVDYIKDLENGKEVPKEELLNLEKQLEEKINQWKWEAPRRAKVPNPEGMMKASKDLDMVQKALGKKKEFYELTKEKVNVMYRMPENKHKEYIENALKEGKEVPEEVLKDYPELKADKPITYDENLFNEIDKTEPYKKYKPTTTEVDWGSNRGQGKRVGNMIVGGMSNAPQGKKTYTDLVGNIPEKEDLKGLEKHEQLKYLKAREYGLNHMQAYVYAAYEHGGLSKEKALERIIHYSDPKNVEATKKEISSPLTKPQEDEINRLLNKSLEKQGKEALEKAKVYYNKENKLTKVEVFFKNGVDHNKEPKYTSHFFSINDKGENLGGSILNKNLEGYELIEFNSKIEAEAPKVEESISTDDKLKSFLDNVKEDDIDYKTAERAYQWNSMSPDRKAKSLQQSYVNRMKNLYEGLLPLAETKEQKEILFNELERYKEGYLKHQKIILAATSRTASAMVTGAAKFPVARNNKALEVERKRIEEYLEWDKKAINSIKKKLKGAMPEEKINNAETERLKKEVLSTAATVKAIKEGKSFGSKPLFIKNLQDKLLRSASNGNVESVKEALKLVKELEGKHDITVFSSRNSIWKMVEEAEKKVAEAPKGQEPIKAYEGAEIINNHDIERVQILMEEKPSDEIRAALKKEGWNYSPSNSAWQRKNTNAAVYSAKNIMDKFYKEAAQYDEAGLKMATDEEAKFDPSEYPEIKEEATAPKKDEKAPWDIEEETAIESSNTTIEKQNIKAPKAEAEIAPEITIDTDIKAEQKLETEVNKILKERYNSSVYVDDSKIRSLKTRKNNILKAITKERNQLGKKKVNESIIRDNIKALERDLSDINKELGMTLSINEKESDLMRKMLNATSVNDFIVPNGNSYGMPPHMKHDFLEELIESFNKASDTDKTITFKVPNDGSFEIDNDIRTISVLLNKMGFKVKDNDPNFIEFGKVKDGSKWSKGTFKTGLRIQGEGVQFKEVNGIVHKGVGIYKRADNGMYAVIHLNSGLSISDFSSEKRAKLFTNELMNRIDLSMSKDELMDWISGTEKQQLVNILKNLAEKEEKYHSKELIELDKEITAKETMLKEAREAKALKKELTPPPIAASKIGRDFKETEIFKGYDKRTVTKTVKEKQSLTPPPIKKVVHESQEVFKGFVTDRVKVEPEEVKAPIEKAEKLEDTKVVRRVANMSQKPKQSKNKIDKASSIEKSNNEIAFSKETEGIKYKESMLKTNTYRKMPDLKTEVIQKIIDDLDLEYEVKTNKESFERAKGNVEADFDGVMDKIREEGLNSAEDTMAAGIITHILKVEAEKNNDFDDLTEWLQTIRPKATKAGQTVQAFKAWQNMTTEGTLIRATKKVAKEFEKIKEENPKAAKKAEDLVNDVTDKLNEVNKNAVDDVVKEVIDTVTGNKASKGTKGTNGATGGTTPPKGSTKGTKPPKNPLEPPEPEEILAGKVKTQAKGMPKGRMDFDQKMIRTLFNIAKESLPEREIIKYTPESFVKIALKNKERYHDVWTKAKLILEEEFAGDPDMLNTLDDYLNQRLRPVFWEQDLNRAIKEKLKEMDINLYDVVKKHYSVNSKVRQDLKKALIDKNFTEEESQYLEHFINKVMKEKTKETKEKILEKMFKEKVKVDKEKYTVIDKIIELSNLGGYSNTKYKDLVFERLGLPNLATEDVRYITKTIEEGKKFPENSYQRRAAFAKVRALIDIKMMKKPSSRVTAARNISLLGNSKTFVRNIGGNSFLAVADNVANILEASLLRPLDNYMSKYTGYKTVAMPSFKELGKGYKKGFKETLKDSAGGITRADLKGKSTLEVIKTYVDGMANPINTNSLGAEKFEGTHNLAFKPKPLRIIENFVRTFLEIGDRPYSQAYLDDVVNQITKANNIKKGEKLSKELMEVAEMVAEERTFQDINALSSFMLGIKHLPKNIQNHPRLAETIQIFVDSLMPYVKTPANILKRSLEYTPIGMIEALLKLGVGIKYGLNVKTQRQIVDRIGRSFIGTGVIAAGAALGAAGLITSDGKDEDKDGDLRNFKRENGIQNNAFKLGNKYYSYEQFQPLSIPLTLGANNNALDLASSIKGAIDFYMNQPMLQGISRLFGNKFDNKSTGDRIIEAMFELPKQFIPTIVNQFNTIFDDYQRDTYSKNNFMAGLINPSIKKLAPKALPQKSSTLGEDLLNYGGENTPFNVLLNPSITTKYKSDPVKDYILDLYKTTGQNTHIPRVVDDYIEYSTGEKQKDRINLNAREKNELQKFVGKRTYEEYNKKISDKDFLKLEPREQAEKLEDILSKVKEEGKTYMLKNRGIEEWNKKRKGFTSSRP